MADERDGAKLERVEEAPQALAMLGKVSRVKAGVCVKPWPGRSKAVTRWSLASSGIRPRNECVEAPVP